MTNDTHDGRDETDGDMTNDAPAVDATAFDAGETVTVRYEGSFRGRTHEVTGEVVTDPYKHRATPDGAIDLVVRKDGGETYKARVRADGRFYGLHHATRRHDHRKGRVLAVDAVAES